MRAENKISFRNAIPLTEALFRFREMCPLRILPTHTFALVHELSGSQEQDAR